MKLHLGVLVVPYTAAPPSTRRRKKPVKGSGSVTTGDVAEWLENKYGVMGFFYERHKSDVAKAMEKSVAGAIENVMLGKPSGSNPFAGAESKISSEFRDFLDRKEMDGQPGVPTMAALKGVNPRLKRKRGPTRPSFVASGLYQSSMRAWFEGNL